MEYQTNEDLYGTPRDEAAWEERLEEDEKLRIQAQEQQTYAEQEAAEDSGDTPSTEGGEQQQEKPEGDGIDL